MSGARAHFEPFLPVAPDRPPLDFTVRAAVPADAEAVALVDAERHGGAPEDALAAIRRDLEVVARGAPRRCAVAITGGEVIAYGRARWRDPGPGPAPSGWYLTGVQVARRHRRRGIAAALVRWRIDALRELGAGEVHSFTSAENLASIGLHEAMGFEEVARGAVVPGIAFTGGVGVLFRRSLAL